MYTYKRNFKLPPINNNRKNEVERKRDRAFYIRSALYICIAVMLVLTYIFINDAAVSADSKQKIAFLTEGKPAEAVVYEEEFQDSLIDPQLILSQEIPVIYGVNLEEVADIEHNDIEFEVLPENIKMEIIKFSSEPKDFNVGAAGPQILIYHSHTEEAYRQIAGDEYAEAGKFYTRDLTNSVAAVGEVMKTELEKYGYTVLHDTTDHMPPSLSTSYSRSIVTMKKYEKEYPSIKIFIDVHRDTSDNTNDFVTVNGEECAKVMFVVGTSDKPNEKANYESNYKLAYAITNELEKIKKGITRPIRLKNGRSSHYNQQESDMCILIEVGHNANSLEQAMNSAKYVALAISRVVEINGQ